jgi:TolB protein
MIVNAGRRRRFGRLAGVLAAGVLAVGAVSLGATAGAAATTASAAQARAQVPWSKVGQGWVLAEYDSGPAGKTAPVTLYLISPAGVRYSMHTWNGRGTTPHLIAWSGDKTRALLGLTGSQYEQLTLSTGKLTVGRLAGQALPTGYTLPDGQNILGVTEGVSSGRLTGTVARYSLAGKLLRVLTRGEDETSAVYAANGTALAVSGAKGLELVSNGGGVIRSLPVPGTDASLGCDPSRWWNATTVLTECLAKGKVTPRLWLVPTNGKKPVPLTPQRSSAGPDLGDVGAWQLSSGLYVQGLTGCGTMEIFRQAANGSIKQVNVPQTSGNNNVVVTALGARLLVHAQTACPGSSSLLWFNPATRAEQWLLRAPASDAGVTGVVAYNSTENAQPF